MTWVLQYSPEADNYLVDNYPDTNNVDLALIALSLTPEGIPSKGAHQLEPGLIMCELERHTIVYRRIPEGHILRILVIKPRDELI